jgi:CopZ-like zinc binding protein
MGILVGLITVKALLTADALRRLDGKSYRFCPGRDCDVVYFDRAANSVFRKSDVRVRVGQKETGDPIPLCYCFDVSVADLRRQVAAEGKTDMPASVAAEVRAGHCACEVRNPQGSCCLGALTTAVERLSEGRDPAV